MIIRPLKGKKACVRFYFVVSLKYEKISHNWAIIQTNGYDYIIKWHYGILINTQSAISISLSGIVDAKYARISRLLPG